MAILPNNTIKVLEDHVSHVSPPPNSVPTTSLPLNFFDMKFLPSAPVQPLFFFEFPFPTSFFMQNILPNFKASLSLTLQHFFPLAGNLVLPPPPQIPYIHYKEGDSVSLFVNESTADFNHLASNNARKFQELQSLVPTLPPAAKGSDNSFMQKPLLAIQVTVFPLVGISIGFAFYHVVADGRAFIHFMKSFASVFSSRGDMTCLKDSFPKFNRDLIEDPLDCRKRLKLPPTYFGNCLLRSTATAKKSELIGENGIFVAARAIAKVVMEFEKGSLKETETLLSSSKAMELIKMEAKNVIMVEASPKFGAYNMSFGSGGTKKAELASIGSSETATVFSIADSREEGGVEYGLALASSELDSFNAIFNGRLKLPFSRL
ncbi:Transferase [Corchorus olitorius]|uniref:Transferase n=1 Tax=Corchorus olitorius TaxID=93759 RepID=A0A1R3GUL2_9ROSI|nr:Transferase [Corchorus olitorius]